MAQQDQAAEFAAFQAWKAQQEANLRAADEVPTVEYVDVITFLVRSARYPDELTQNRHLETVAKHFAPPEPEPEPVAPVHVSPVAPEPTVESGSAVA